MTEPRPEVFDTGSYGQAGGISDDKSELPVSNNASGLNDIGGFLTAVPPVKVEELNRNVRTAGNAASPIDVFTGGEKDTLNNTGTAAHDSKDGSRSNHVGASATPYYQQFTNMNAQAQAQEVMRNSYQPYHRPPANDDPEVAQAMLNLGSQNANEMPPGDHGNDPGNAGNFKSSRSSNPTASLLVGEANNFSDAGVSPHQHNEQTERHGQHESALYSTESNRSLKDFHDDHYQEFQNMTHVSNTSHQDLRPVKDGNDGMDDTGLISAISQSHHYHSHPRQQHMPYPVQPSNHHYNYGFVSNNHQNPSSHGHHQLGFPVPFQPYQLDHHRDDSMVTHHPNGHAFYSAHQEVKTESMVPRNIGNMQSIHQSGQIAQQGHYPDHLQHSANIPQYMVNPSGANFMDSFSHGHSHLQQQQQVLQVTQSKMDSIQKKRKRPVDMPRRPLSAYNFFFSEERVRLLAEIPNPDAEQASGANDISTENTTVEDNNKEEIHDVTSASSERLLKIRDAKVMKRRPHRKSHGKIAFKDLAREVGKRWKSLNDVEKSRYNELAEKDLQRYNEQMKDYNSKRNRFAGASYQTSPGPLPPQLNVTTMNISSVSNEKSNVSTFRNIPSNLSRGHMQAGQSSNLNQLDAQHPNVFNSMPIHYPHEGAPHPIDSNDANFFLSTSVGIDASPFDSHLSQYTMDAFHSAHSQQTHNKITMNAGGSMPSIDVGATSESECMNND
eukprot:CAMPEP_0176480332 /NCGR_PEP_ID=MMETSP0200_2-20121128/2221_1 /TAXON_ID=947934 /ORGANISM="Chaetoceros sp., Strain GSL56" /LENGTH=722 /DNA_ID=CAMNT_0017876445 /DNA_START=158 /DNA_END=2326 /DNA_ORIENTATION=+